MRSLFVIPTLVLLFLTLSAVSQAAFTFQQATGSFSSASATSLSSTFGSANTAGCMILVAAGGANSTALFSGVSDTAGNTYTAAANTTLGASNPGYFVGIYYATNIAAQTSNTVTVSFSSSVTYSRLAIHEVCGQSASPFDVGTSASVSGGSSNITTGSITTTASGDLLMAWGIDNAGITSAGTGFTLWQTVGSESTEYRVLGAAGAYTATFPTSSDSDWMIAAAAFKQAVASSNTSVLAGSFSISGTGAVN